MLVSQAEQIFYVKDSKLSSNWKVVVKIQAWDLYDVPKHEDEELSIDDELNQQKESILVTKDRNPTTLDASHW